MASAQVLKPIDWNKTSKYQQKQFGTKGFNGEDYDTNQYPEKGLVRTKSYTTREFSQSSKGFQLKPARTSSKQIATPGVLTKSVADGSKKFTTKNYGTKKEVRSTPLAHQIADKPTLNWQTFIRKAPPKGLPGKHTDLPFSEWKATSELP